MEQNVLGATRLIRLLAILKLVVSLAQSIKHAENLLLFHHLRKYQTRRKDTVASSSLLPSVLFSAKLHFRNALHQPRQTHSAHHACTGSDHRRSRHSHRRIARIRCLLG